MKSLMRILYFFLILVLFSLSACSAGGVNSKLNCSRGEEICVDLRIAQSFSLADPVPFTLVVTSSKDYDDLHVALWTSGIILDGPETWEKNSLNGYIDGSTAFWDFSIKAGETITFSRIMHFPVKEANYQIIVDVVTQGRIIDAKDTVNIQTKNDRGKVYKSGTPVPFMQSSVTSEAYGPGTPAPSPISNPTNPGSIPPTQAAGNDQTFPQEGPLDNTDNPYPPPTTPIPTETITGYP